MNFYNNNTLKLGTSILAHLLATRPHDQPIELYPTANNLGFQFLPGKSLGEEWQVQSNTDEPVLFQEKRAPQYPTGCSYEKKALDKNRFSPHRRLVDRGMKMDVALAEEACSKVTGYKRSFCIQDVVATGDIELAEDSFYD